MNRIVPGCCAKRHDKCLSHPADEYVRILSGKHIENYRKYNKTMNKNANNDCHQIEAQFLNNRMQIVHFNDLRHRQTEYTQWREIDHPCGDFHQKRTRFVGKCKQCIDFAMHWAHCDADKTSRCHHTNYVHAFRIGETNRILIDIVTCTDKSSERSDELWDGRW